MSRTPLPPLPDGRPANRPIRIVTISTLFPNAAQPRHGIFIEHRLRYLQYSGRVAMEIFAPVPWFPWSNPIFGAYAQFARAPYFAERGPFRIHHPRYLVLPKMGMSVTPATLALSLVGPIRAFTRQSGDFDLINAFYFYPDGVAAALLGAVFGKPVVIHALGTDINLIPKYPLPRAMLRWAAGRAAGISTVCQALKDELCALGVPSNKVRIILHGVDLELFQPPVDRDADRAALGLNSRTLISVGHLIERKGHHIAIEALAQLQGVKLLIAGDGEMEPELRQLVARLGVADRVQFLGHVDQTELRKYLGAADALVLASSREGIANVLLEAMACGTPVVATNVWGAPEVITDAAAGILAPERTPDSIATCIRRLFASYPDRAKTRRFVERYSWYQTAKDDLRLIEDVLSRTNTDAE